VSEACVVGVYHVLVIQSADEPHLAEETVAGLFTMPAVEANQFDGNLSWDTAMTGQEDSPHPTGSKAILKHVLAEHEVMPAAPADLNCL
jgi:hypothetical protein